MSGAGGHATGRARGPRPGDAHGGAAAPGDARGLVIFDCDGVLVDSEGISMRELTRALARAGGTLSEAEVRERFVGIAMADVERKAAEHLGRPLPDDFIARFVAERAEAFERELRPVPGAREAIDGLRAAGWEACIASGGRMSKMEQTLRITGLRDAIPDDRIFSATMVARGKPAPDLFLHAAAACGYLPPACVVVEDSVPGVTAARAAAMRTFGYANGDAAHAARLRELGAQPLHALQDLPDLLAR
ncbi:MAG TPA: HAD-IA family hydrolase [Conexibacter sp.]